MQTGATVSRDSTWRVSHAIPDPPDEVLVVRFQSGDRAAFAMLVRRHQSGLYNFALRNLRERTAAEDIVQEAFVRVAQSAADFKSDARFSTWVYTIVRNLCIDQIRKNALRRHPSLDESRKSDEGEVKVILPKKTLWELGRLLSETDRRFLTRRTLWHWRSIARFVRKHPEQLRAVISPRSKSATKH